MMDSSAANDDDENSKETDDQKDLINLPQPVKISANKIHECDVCSKQFSRKDRLTRHKLVHLKTKPDSCEVCLMTFARYDQMERHLRTHRNDDTYVSDLRSTNVHQCNICLKEFSRKDIMKKHMFTLSGIKPFTCEICFKAFGRRDHMEKHFRTHSKDKSLSDSLFELMSYQQQTGDDLPIIKIEAEEPSFCEMETNYQTASANDWSETKLNVLNKATRIFECTLCPKKFFRKDIYKKHMFIHSGLKPFSCENESEPVFNGVNVSEDIQPQWCLKEESEFSETDTSRDIKIEIGEESLITSHIHTPNTNDVLQVHSKIRNKSKNILQCTLCPRQFLRKDLHKKHLHTDSGIRPFSCEICLKSFGRRDNLKYHMRTHFKKKIKNETIPVSESEVNLSEYCQWSLMDETRWMVDASSIEDNFSDAEQMFMRTHMQTSSNDDYSQSDPKLAKTEVFQCTICVKEFSRRDVLKKHMFTHSGIKPFSCEICGKAFGRKDYLKKHSLSHTREIKSNLDDEPDLNITADGRFQCIWKDDDSFECGKYFSSRWSLKKHVKTHSNFDMFKCDICSKRFSKKESLIQHLDRHFPSKRDDLKCEICSKEFSRKDRLKRHMNTHTNVRAFSCTVCSKTFRRKHHLQRHCEGHNTIKMESD